MKITIDDVSGVFDRLINGSITREAAAEWAQKAMSADDIGELTCYPKTEESRIWSAISYLSGVDLRASPEEYLHVIADFVAFRDEIGL